MPKVFISYRRGDSAGHTGRLYDRLADHFGQDQVFMDVDTIRPGLDFVEVVQQAVADSDGLIAVIGIDWLTASDATGGRRLDQPNDMVKLEIAAALERGILVIPVLVQEARMPVATELPEELKDLATRNALEMSDARFRSDVDRLIQALQPPKPEPREAAVPVVTQARPEGVFVGRDREIGELNTALEETLAGQGRLVMLVGEPGIGKTRIAEELASLAEQRGAQVLWGRSHEEEGAPPYWPWVQMLRTYIQQKDREQLASEMGPGAADIAELVSEVRVKLPDLESPAALEPEQARFRLFDSITAFLKNAAQFRPVMLILEDLHWADRSSLLLLQFLAREMSESCLLVVGTYRDVELSRQHPLSETLAQLTRQPVFRRELLRGLSQEDTQRFVESAAGVEPSRTLVETIYTHTEGNPFFLTEVVRLLSEQGELTSEEIGGSTDFRIPEGVREVIGQRLNRLSDQCNQVLATASIIGREFDFRLLSAVSEGIAEIPMLEAIDEAVGTNLIEEVPGGRERYQFSHALIQQTLVREWTTSRRVRLHARIGAALEEQYGTSAELQAAELAYHFGQAEPVLGPEQLVRYSLLAGEQALATFAWEEAREHFQRGLEAKRFSLTGAEPATDAETAELLFGLGRAQVGVFPLYRVREAIATLSRAFNYYADVQDVERALAVVGYPIIAIGTGRRTERAKMLERAMTMIPPDSNREGRLLSEYGLALGLQEGDDDGAQEAFNRALAIARREGDAALEMRTLIHAARLDQQQSRMRECLEKCLLALELVPRADDLAAEASAHQMAANSLWMSGNLEAARYHAAAVMVPAQKVGDRFSTLNAFLLNSRLAMLSGDWVVARSFAEQGMAVAPLDARLLFNQIMLEYQVGDLDQGEVYIERLLEVMQITTPGPNLDTVYLALAISLAARITGSGERMDVAEMAAEAALSSTSAPLVATLVARTAQAILSVIEGDAVAAAEHYTVLESESGTMLSNNADIRADRVLGMLAHTMGNLDQAAAHFEDALAFCRKAGYRPELAWTCCDSADTLLQRNDPGDREKAMSLLDESLAISSELGMRPLMERVLSRREILGA